LIHLAIQNLEEAHELVGAFLQYNDNTVERRLFYQALDALLEILLDEELEPEDYLVNLRRMFGNERVEAAMGSANASIRFYGLTPTSKKLEGLDRHHRLIDSYKKIHTARSRAAAASQRLLDKHPPFKIKTALKLENL
jgi:ribosomal protein S12 methylthiotransferase accessory factor